MSDDDCIKKVKNALELENLLDDLEYRSCDLRCLSEATGGDDYNIVWVVIEHYMAAPKEREIGRGSSILKALKDAFKQ